MNKQRALSIIDAWANDKDVVFDDHEGNRWIVTELFRDLSAWCTHEQFERELPEDVTLRVEPR